jgi:hypothetical protein
MKLLRKHLHLAHLPTHYTVIAYGVVNLLDLGCDILQFKTHEAVVFVGLLARITFITHMRPKRRQPQRLFTQALGIHAVTRICCA